MDFHFKSWTILRMKPLRLRLGPMEKALKGLTYCELGLREVRGKLSDYAQGYPVWSFFLFHDGAECEIEGTWTELAPHSVVAWGPGAPQRYGRREGKFDHSWLRGSGSDLKRLLRCHGLVSGRPQVMAERSSGERFFRDVLAEYRGRARPDQDILGLRTALWLRELARDRMGEKETGPIIPPEFLQARERVEMNLDAPLDLSALAAEAGCSSWHFCTRFRRLFGLSPMALRRRRRLEQAALMLGDQERSVAEVAEACGFEDAFYFSRAFRQHHGCSPRDWRRSDGGRPEIDTQLLKEKSE
jgi:AraC family transcriptional regulator of arabinose operon